MRARSRIAIVVPAWAALAGFCWLAVQVYTSHAQAAAYPGPWTIGPPVDVLNRHAEARLNASLEHLRDSDRPITARIADYQEELRTAEALLERSLRARPPQAQTLARLAATRWELARPTTEPGLAKHLAMIDLASSMAPTVPRVQYELGKLLLQMDRPDDANVVFARTLELDPERSSDVVRLLQERRFSSSDILQDIPQQPELLAALAPVFRAEGRTDDYRQLLERDMDPDHAESIAAYGKACLDTENGIQLVHHLNALGQRATQAAETARLKQLSFGHLSLFQHSEAIEAARRARQQAPDSGALAEHLGDIARLSGATDDARQAYRDALAIWAQQPGKPQRRARQYMKIGRTHDADDRPDLAYEAYQMALRIHETQSYARRRIAEIDATTGVKPRLGGNGE